MGVTSPTNEASQVMNPTNKGRQGGVAHEDSEEVVEEVADERGVALGRHGSEAHHVREQHRHTLVVRALPPGVCECV